MPDCSIANIAAIAGRLGPEDKTRAAALADVQTVFACASSQEDGAAMAKALVGSRGEELSLRAQIAGGIPNFRAEYADNPTAATTTPEVTPSASTRPGGFGSFNFDPGIATEDMPDTPEEVAAAQARSEQMKQDLIKKQQWQQANTKLVGDLNPFQVGPNAEAAAAASGVTEPGTPGDRYTDRGDTSMMPSSAELFHPTLSPEEVAQNLRDQVTFAGGDEWLANAGVTTTGLANVDPTLNPGVYLNLYGKSQGMPEYWARQNAALAGTLPGIYALNNPGGDPLSPAASASLYDELGEGGILGTPGQYLSAGAEWDKLMSPEMMTAGGESAADIALLPPAQQVEAVTGGFKMLAPYMTAAAADAVANKLQIAQDHWNEARVTGYNADFFTFLRDEERADEWL